MPNTSPPPIVAVVVTFNRRAQIETTVARLCETPASILGRIVVIDNGSTDGTREWLAAHPEPRLDVLQMETNVGGAGGFEAGMRIATERYDPDWIVVMDDDARPEPRALETFLEAAPAPDRCAAAAIFYPNGEICEMNRPSVNPFWHPWVFLRSLFRGRDGYHIPYEAYLADAPRPIDLASFVGFFVPRAVIADVGYPDAGLFLYGDDVLYTLGLRRRGHAIDFRPDVRFEHDCSTFQDDRARRFRPLWKVYYAYRNSMMMYRAASGPAFHFLVPILRVKWHLAARRYEGDRDAYLDLKKLAIEDALAGRTDRTHAEIIRRAEG